MEEILHSSLSPSLSLSVPHIEKICVIVEICELSYCASYLPSMTRLSLKVDAPYVVAQAALMRELKEPYTSIVNEPKMFHLSCKIYKELFYKLKVYSCTLANIP